MLGSVIRRYGDFTACEDAVQEALLVATERWPRDGLPDNPRGWLIQVASRRMIDPLRSEDARRRREAVAVRESELRVDPAADSDDTSAGDEALILIYMCCHPALTQSSAIALTRRAVGGLTTAEIANAFMVPEATMAQRISREAERPLVGGALPPARRRGADAAAGVRAACALPHLQRGLHDDRRAGPLPHRPVDRSDPAHARGPRAASGDAEVAGLLALMLLTDARRGARTGVAGELIPLTRQHRSLWDRDQIAEGVALISETLPKGAVGIYQLQAAIAAVHDEAARAEDTDWRDIHALYCVLERLSDNPMVTLNRAIALAMVHGPAAGLDLLDSLDADSRLKSHHRLDAVRAHLFEMAGERRTALAHYWAAAERTTNVPERDYLLTQAARLPEDPG